uniref:Uncharacterized protein n=1 Tax=Anguilla anguilla TaxID=7936 RepID=A0A0E9U9C3_ANGAN
MPRESGGKTDLWRFF